MAMGDLKALWEGYRKKWLSKLDDPAIAEEFRQAFYAGALAHHQVMDGATKLPDDRLGVMVINALDAEVFAFRDAMALKRPAKAKPEPAEAAAPEAEPAKPDVPEVVAQ